MKVVLLSALPLALGGSLAALPRNPPTVELRQAVSLLIGGRTPNILVVLVDSLRTDRVGACGGTRGLTPAMDAFAAEGAVFPRARTSSPWTKPAVASLLTGVRPERHGMGRTGTSLAGTFPTLFALARKAGYRTTLLSDSHWANPTFGLERDVDGPYLWPECGDFRGSTFWRTAAFFRDYFVGAYDLERPSTQRGAAALSDRLLEWADRQGDAPWGAYLHWMEPHHPYAPAAPAEPGRRRVPAPEFLGTVPLDSSPVLPDAVLRDLQANYDDGVREADAAFGRLVAGLRGRGLLDHTIVLLLADHGEEFHEHGGWTHGHSLFEEVARIPVLLRCPDGLGRGARPAEDAVIEDLLPTLLETAGIRTDARFDGRSLVPLLRGETLPARPACGFLRRVHGEGLLRSAVLGDRKVLSAERGSLRKSLLFDLAADPGETHAKDAAGEEGPLLQALRAMEALDAPSHGPDAPISSETREALRGLGYLGSGEDGPR